MNQSIELELSDRGNRLYIFFGGRAARIVVPPFEFYNASRIIDEHKIFVRDFTQSWYQDRLPGIGEDIFSAAEYIRKLISDIRPDETVFVGNSMGGFAAIAFSELIGLGKVIAFAPQTFISPLRRLRYGDIRWQRQILRTYGKSILKRRIWDLRPLLLQRSERSGISIFVSRASRLDYIHAIHVRDVHGVRIHELDDGGHGIVRLLRDQGKLPSIMSGSYS